MLGMKSLLAVLVGVAYSYHVQALAIPAEIYNNEETVELGLWLYPNAENMDGAPREARYMPLISGDLDKLNSFIQMFIKEIAKQTNEGEGQEALQNILQQMSKLPESEGDYGDLYDMNETLPNSIPQIATQKRGGNMHKRAGLKKSNRKRTGLSTEVSMDVLRNLIQSEVGRRDRDEAMKGLLRMG